MRNVIKKYPATAFYIACLLFLIMIGLGNMLLFPASFEYLLILPQWSPALAAILIVFILGGKQQVKKLLKKVSWNNISLKWLLIALVMPIALCSLSYLILSFIEYKQWVSPVFSRPLWNYAVCLLAALFGSYGEEIGWRGYLLPILLKKYSFFLSSLIIGLLWGVWHLKFQTPLIAILYVISVIEFSLIISWLCSKTKSNILVAIAFHTAINMCSLLFFENIITDTANPHLQILLYEIYVFTFIIPCVFIVKNMLLVQRLNNKNNLK